MAKKKTVARRLVPLTIMVTPDQLQRIIDLSNESDLSMARIVRQLIDNDLKKEGGKK